ncbi:MAG TPA: hypothetical protein PLV45_18325, partial [bacterium]|nr:hypothetical protein [bacterium]
TKILTGPIFEVTGVRDGSPVAGSLAIPFSLHGTDIHIDPVTGSDETGTGSPDTPFKTIGAARDAVRGSPYHRITLRPHAGIYSEDTGEGPWPVWTDEFEDIRGDGPSTEIWNLFPHDPSTMFLPSRTTNMSDFSIYSVNPITGITIENSQNTEYCRIFSDWMSDAAIGCKFKGYHTAEIFDCTMVCVSADYDFDESELYIHDCIFRSAGFVQNYVFTSNRVMNSATIGPIDIVQRPPNTVTDNVFMSSIEMRTAQVFENNISDSMLITTDTAYTITGNINRVSYAVDSSSAHVTFVNNIVIHETTDFPTAFGTALSASPQYINCIHLPLVMVSDDRNGFNGFASSFRIDGCITMLRQTGIDHGSCLETRNSSIYYNIQDNSACYNTSYSNLKNCPGATNLDTDPGYVGVGRINRIGDTWFADDTAAWEPDRYAGYYVNPNIYGNTDVYYCTGNTDTTIFLNNDPRGAAQPGDLFILPDVRLRRVADGFAFDSPLIDAGDPAEVDPDGS